MEFELPTGAASSIVSRIVSKDLVKLGAHGIEGIAFDAASAAGATAGAGTVAGTTAAAGTTAVSAAGTPAPARPRTRTSSTAGEQAEGNWKRSRQTGSERRPYRESETDAR